MNFFEPARSHIIFQAIVYLKSTINSMKILLVQKVSQVQTCSDFLILMLELKENMRVTEKIIMSEKETNDFENEIN